MEAQIVLIEDSKPLRILLRKALEKAEPGWKVREMESGQQAFRELDVLRDAGLIITDLETPGLEGGDYLRKLAAEPSLKEKFILVLSGAFSMEAGRIAQTLGNMRFLQKPCPPSTIIEAARRLLHLEAAS